MKLTRSYTRNHNVEPDGSVSFDCSDDVEQWPWLALPAQHPLVIQTQNFWSSVGASSALGTRDDSKWSALTWTDWTLGDPEAGRAKRGIFSNDRDGDALSFATTLYDDEGRLIVSMRGKGVVFRTRNFEKWREGSKEAARQNSSNYDDFIYADAGSLGLSEAEPPLIAPLTQTGSTLRTQALITRENGLMPAHPYFSGSGDHVNSVHMIEVARQALCLLTGDPKAGMPRGEMQLDRYIELGTPFDVVVTQNDNAKIVLTLRQLERDCARITLPSNAS